MSESYGYSTHVVQSGDSLQRLAILYGIDDWREIAYFNKLDPPYIVNEVINTYPGNVAHIGTVLYIPTYDYTVSPKIEDISQEAIEQQAYGCDLDIYSATDDNGKMKNIEVKGECSATDNDLRMVKGIENLKQALQIRLSTEKGSLMLHPDFGSNLSRMCGLKGSTENLTKMMLEAQECLLSDFRVNGLSDLKLEKTERVVKIECIIIPIPPLPQFPFSSIVTG